MLSLKSEKVIIFQKFSNQGIQNNGKNIHSKYFIKKHKLKNIIENLVNLDVFIQVLCSLFLKREKQRK